MFIGSLTRQFHALARFQPRKSDKNLSALGGYESVIDRVTDLVRYLQNPTAFAKQGLQPFKGIILSGPPGVGKSLLAEAVAGQAGVPIILTNGPEMQNSAMQEPFKKAKAVAPCVLCIDEIETIAASRITSGGNVLAYQYNSKVNQLLSLLSQDRPGVVVIGTTNNFEQLDEAIVHPGRIDRHIPLTLPNQVDRTRILEIHAKNKNLGSTISLGELAAISTGYSGAKLAGWVNEAAICAFRESSKTIEPHHFDAAHTLLEMGILNQSTSNPRQKFLIAAHEAGHAVVGHLLNHKLYIVSTKEHGYTAGYTEWIPTDDGKNPEKKALLNQICLLLAGRAAELVLKSPMLGSESDLVQAKFLAEKMVLREGLGSTLSGSVAEMENILQAEMIRAKELIEKNIKTWERVRDALIEHGELFEVDFAKVLAGKTLAKRAKKV